ncbi:hypothetical protein [Sulfuricurvum sp.]|uniref:hypothetical protein n=1 Tax=Sulfuricurvum sp. TaxID=2025608 RepID=UPI003563EE85
MKAFIMAHIKSPTTWAGLAVIAHAAQAYALGKIQLQPAILQAVIGLIGVLSKDMKK